MAQNTAELKPTMDDRAGRDVITIWDRWQPACDTCGRLGSSVRERLIPCAWCGVAKYCSSECQKRDGEHRNRCHLVEVDRKLSEVFVKSLGPGSINDPVLPLHEKAVQWSHVNSRSRLDRVCGSENDEELAKNMQVGIFLRLIEGCTKHDDRFIIDKVALMPRTENEGWTNVKIGFCRLPGGQMSYREWMLFIDPQITLPPGFTLHRYITHVNRGITHFHTSFWPLPRKLSDADFDAAQPPPGWYEYMRRYPVRFTGMEGQDVFGVERRYGTRVPLYRYTQHAHKEGKVNTMEFKKLLDDPSRRRVRMVREDYLGEERYCVREDL